MQTRYSLTMLLVCAPAIHAGPLVIFDTLGALNQFNPALGLTVGDGIQLTAAQAIPPLPNVRFGRIEVAVGYDVFPGPPSDAAFLDLTIAVDAIGVPGAILETIHLTNLFGNVANSSGIVAGESILHPLLSGPAPYWLILSVPSLLNTTFDWKVGGVPILAPLASRCCGGPWILAAPPTPAMGMRITAADVPEPGTGFGAAFVVIVLLVRRALSGPRLS